MTPLHLSILVHYYTTGEEHPLIMKNETITDYAYELATFGLLYTPKVEDRPTPLFRITEYGKEVIEKCLLTLKKTEPEDWYNEEFIKNLLK